MPKTTVRWVGDRTFVGTDSRQHSVVLSGDQPPRGVSPSEMLLVALSVWGFGWAEGFRGMLTASIFFGLGGGVSNPALMAMSVHKGSQAAAMGSVMAYLTMAHSLGMLAGSLLGGMMMDLFHLRQAFLLGMFIMLAGVAAFYLLTRLRPAAVPSVAGGSGPAGPPA